MRRTAWTIRVGFLLVSALLLVAALQVRRDQAAAAPELERVSGVTGQRQPISFEVNDDGHPQAFVTTLWSHCPGANEQRADWAPWDGAPVAFRWNGRMMFVREQWPFYYEDGARGSVVSTMTAEARDGRIEGFGRSVWRFERDGREYLACDSGSVPFATGPHAESRLERVARFTQPITLYPNTPEARRPASFAQRRFLLRVDRACGRLVQGGQLAALRHLGQPPEAGSTYRRWLRNLDRRIDLEGRQLQLWQRRDFAGAASLAARIATLRAQGNAAGIAFGLRSCTSEGPTGAPKS